MPSTRPENADRLNVYPASGDAVGASLPAIFAAHICLTDMCAMVGNYATPPQHARAAEVKLENMKGIDRCKPLAPPEATREHHQHARSPKKHRPLPRRPSSTQPNLRLNDAPAKSNINPSP
jgi:hypothetical protein